jgi:hypothetical protein
VITSDPTIAFPYAITSVNSITVKVPCSAFFGDLFTVLEEYHHVFYQFNTGRLNEGLYVWHNFLDGGYNKNRWELESKGFAGKALPEFEKCVKCCK